MRFHESIGGRLARLGVALLAVTVFGAAPVRADEPRLDPNVAPTFEAVNLNLDADQETYTGSVRIEIRVAKPTRAFLFHAEEMTIDRATLEGKAGPIAIEVADAGDRGTRRATAQSDLAPGDYVLTVQFSKPYNTRAVGLYRVHHEGHSYLFSQMESLDCRKAFPCWDEPIYKIPWQMTITVPLQQEAVSNAPVEKETRGAATKTLVFKRTPPTSSYLIAIAAGPFESVVITGLSVPGRIYTVKGAKAMAKHAASITPKILVGLENYFGTKYPFEKLDFIAVPEYWYGAMENPGAVTFNDKILLIDPAAASLAQKRSVAMVTTHELAHMWFGDLVTMSWWDDLWLNESFADWLAMKLMPQMFPDYRYETTEVGEVNQIMLTDARPSTVAVRRPVDSGADIEEDLGLAYEKGRTVLRMTEEFIGPDAFQRGVRDYLDRHKWGNAVGQDLFTALSHSADKNLEPLLASFLDQPGYPLVKVDVNSNGLLTVSQKRFLNAGVKADDQQWAVPVRLKISDGKDVQTRVVMLDRPSATVEVNGKVDWVMPDAGGVGYYRWVVPAGMMMKLAEDPEQTMSPRERARYLGNVRALLNGGEITGDEYLALAAAFSKHPDPDVVASLMADLGSLKMPFITDDLKDPFAAYVRRTLGPARDRFGIEPSADDVEAVKLIRPGLITWLGDDGKDPDVRAFCKDAARRYVDDPTSIDVTIAGAVLAVSASDGTAEMFKEYQQKAETTKVPAERSRYLSALGKFDDPKLQDAVLDYALTDKVRPTEMFQVVSGMFDTEAGRDKLYAWITKNYDRLAGRMPPEFVAYMPYFVTGCSEQRLDAARKFFAVPAHNVDGTDANLAKVSDTITDCLNLREREGKAVAGYLRTVASAP
jgi:alanyl aminopeptidase